MSSLRNLFWVLSLGVIAAYLFFFALGAFSVGEVVPLSIAVGVLVVLWVVHAVLQRRVAEETLDPLLMRARERRGF
jgi:heme exporter protein D